MFEILADSGQICGIMKGGQICGCRDYKWLRVQAVAEKHFQCRLCTGRREDCGSIGKRCAKPLYDAPLRMLHIFSDIETQTGCLQNSRTPRTAFVCRRSQKWKNLILQIPWIWNACVLMHCCSHMSWICNIWIKNIFNTWQNPPLGSFYWGKCCKKYFFKLKILFECDQWPFYAELRGGTRCDERRRTKGQQSRGARSAHCFLVHPPTFGHYDYFWGFHMFCTLNSLDAVDTRLSFPCPDDPVVGGEEHVLGSANRHAVHG